MSKIHTDFEQSKKLEKILPIESADMLFPPGESGFAECIKVPMTKERWTQAQAGIYPCWSLSALLDVLPRIHKLKPILDLEECSIQYSADDPYLAASNPVDACYEMIVKLHEKNELVI